MFACLRFSKHRLSYVLYPYCSEGEGHRQLGEDTGTPQPCKKKGIRQNTCGADDLKRKPNQSLTFLILFPGSDAVQEKSPKLPHGCYIGVLPPLVAEGQMLLFSV